MPKNRFLIFCTKVFLRLRRPAVPSFSAVLRLEVEEKGEERTIVLIHLAALSPVVVPDKESPHVPNNKRKSGCCRACRHPVRGCTILAHWQASEKDAACSSCCWWSCHHLAWGWSLSSHYRWCRRAFKETSAVNLRRPVRTPPFRRRELRLREQASYFDSRSSKATFFPTGVFPSWSVETPENLKTLDLHVDLSIRVEPTL